MTNSYQLNNLYNKHMKEYGELMGDLYNIYTINYSAIDNQPILKYSGLRGRVDPTGPKYSEPTFAGLENYSLFFNRQLLETGDLIVYGTIDQINLERPYITVMHKGPIKEHVGFRSSRKCNIGISRNQDSGEYNTIYENVYYDILDVGYPTGTISNNTRNAAQVPISKLCIYRRDNIQDIRTMIIDIDPATGNETGEIFFVKEIDVSGTVMILTVQSNFRD